ncbi:hypothetical protein Tco_1580782, partial [Tanacetum coccineum]
MCDKKNSVLFTKTECLILSPSFKLLGESQVVLRAPRKDDVYSLDLKNIVPSGEPKENIRKRSGRRLKMKAPKRSKTQKTDSDHEEENQLRTFLKKKKRLIMKFWAL